MNTGFQDNFRLEIMQAAGFQHNAENLARKSAHLYNSDPVYRIQATTIYEYLA